MACSKCSKKKISSIKTLIVSDSFKAFSRHEIDDNVYFVQATSNTIVDIGQEVVRFLPGQLVNMTGTLLCSILASDARLFRFRRNAERVKFLEAHSSFRGVI